MKKIAKIFCLLKNQRIPWMLFFWKQCVLLRHKSSGNMERIWDSKL